MARARWLIPALLVLAALAPLALRHRITNAYVFDPGRRLTYSPGRAKLPYREVVFRTEDGVELHGWWIPAKSRPAIAHVLYFHGAGGNMGHRVGLAKLFSDRALDVFLFDYRGYGESEGTPSEEGTYRDAEAAYDEVGRD